jgi:hypothetical protein
VAAKSSPPRKKKYREFKLVFIDEFVSKYKRESLNVAEKYSKESTA